MVLKIQMQLSLCDASNKRSADDPNQPVYHKHAVLSQAVYDPVKFQSNYKQLDYDIDPELNQMSRTLFYDKSKSNGVIAYKGTNPQHIGEI